MKEECYVCTEKKKVVSKGKLTFDEKSIRCSHGHVICYHCILLSKTRECMICKEDLTKFLQIPPVVYKMEEISTPQEPIVIREHEIMQNTGCIQGNREEKDCVKCGMGLCGFSIFGYIIASIIIG